jgi:S1-C subfamily serine protease
MKIARIYLAAFVLLAVVAFFSVQTITSHAQQEQPQSVQSVVRTRGEQATIDLYKRAKDAVVYISTVTLSIDPDDFFAHVRPREGSGSGIIVDAKRGIIITNLHVIENARQIEILLTDGQPRSAKLLGYDHDFDLAVLQLEDSPQGLVEIPFGDSSIVEVGQSVYAIGNPFGLSQTLTSGIISSLDRAVRNSDGSVLRGLIQTDAAINPGNSGGPLLDSAGNLIGINTAILSQSGDSAGIGFAVPSNLIRRVLPELIATGKILRPKIGWILLDTKYGPMVRRVITGAPAEKAGIQGIEREIRRGPVRMWVRDFDGADLIVSANGTAVRTAEDVDAVVQAAGRESSVVFELKRGPAGELRKVKIMPVLQ